MAKLLWNNQIDFTNFEIKKAYVYANSQILAEEEPQIAQSSQRYFYLHDRLGSVRQIINSGGTVVAMYTYSPFGETIEEQGTIDNDFKFTGQYFDREIGQYYLRARQYSPYLSRFTARDLIMGKFDDPMSLHKYLYCQNDPINRWDPIGLFYELPGKKDKNYNLLETQILLDFAVIFDKVLGYSGAIIAHGLNPADWEHGVRALFDYKGNFGFSFDVGYSKHLTGSEFGNYCPGYALYYNFGMAGLNAVYTAGQAFALSDWLKGDEEWHGWGNGGIGFDDFGSIFFITKGALDANRRALDWFEHPTSTGLFRPGTLDDMVNDNPVQRYFEKVRFRGEGKLLAYMAQFYEAAWMAEGGK